MIAFSIFWFESSFCNLVAWVEDNYLGWQNAVPSSPCVLHGYIICIDACLRDGWMALQGRLRLHRTEIGAQEHHIADHNQ